MSETVFLRKMDETPTKTFDKLLEGSLKSYHEGKSKLFVSKEKIAAIIGDASEFYRKIEKLGLNPKLQARVAMQLSLDYNKCPVDLFRDAHMWQTVDLADMQKARKMTGVGSIEKPTEYIDSAVSFLVESGWLDRKQEGKVAGIAKETLARYEKRRRPFSDPMTLSAAAVFYASCKTDKPVNAYVIGDIMGITEKSIHDASNRLMEIAWPNEHSQISQIKKG